ncbi:MAG: hypothetical protein R3C10_24560 [Pirellulales bacterium]
MRVRTATGISNCAPVHGRFVARSRRGRAQQRLRTPQPIDLDRTVTGVVTNEDVDYFVVAARQGD